MKKPILKVIEGGRSALEREALYAILYDVPKFNELHQRLKSAPVPGDFKIVSAEAISPDGSCVPGQ
jgi:hypothetical protein